MKGWKLSLILLVVILFQCSIEDEVASNIKHLNNAVEVRGASCTGLIEQQLWIVGHWRTFFIDVPDSFEPDSTYPLVIALHGNGGKACSWNQRIGPWVDDQGYLGVYPQSLDTGYWYVGPPLAADSIADVKFIKAIKDFMVSEYHVATSRIYLLGNSNGGGLAYKVAQSVL